jgi:hypothetical protein
MAMVKGAKSGASKDEDADILALVNQGRPEAALNPNFPVFIGPRKRRVQFKVLNMRIAQFHVKLYQVAGKGPAIPRFSLNGKGGGKQKGGHYIGGLVDGINRGHLAVYQFLDGAKEGLRGLGEVWG